MILRFLKGLPHTLTQPMHREYEDKCKELARWRERTKSGRIAPYLKSKDSIEFLFAVGIYYRYIIAPLTSSDKFLARLAGRGSGSVRVGGHVLGAEFRLTLQKAIIQFSQICTNFGLPESFFAQTDVRRIVLSLVEFEERASNAEEIAF